MEKERVKSFVKGVLGCSCEDAVFDHIEGEKISLPSGGELKRLVVGGRLLLYIVGPDLHPLKSDQLLGLVQSWLEERDALHLNRLRIVFASASESLVQDGVIQLLQPLLKTDGRLHLHFIRSDEITACGL